MMGKELSIVQIILESGPVVKLVLLILLALSVLSWGIVFLKRFTIKSMKKNNREFFQIYQKSSALREVVNACSSLPFSPYKAVFLAGHQELESIKNSRLIDQSEAELRAYFDRYGLEAVCRAMKKGVNETTRRLEANSSLLASIGSVTPFIGLFGTVWGIINSFTGLAQGGASLDAVAPGIAEALVATAVGLFAAIPAVWFYNYYNNINNGIYLDLNSFEQDFLNNVERNFV